MAKEGLTKGDLGSLASHTLAEETTDANDGPDPNRDAQSYMEEGDKFYAFKKWPEAVEAFSFAVEKMNEQHGEMHPKTVTALYAYGKALWQSGVAQNVVLGGGGPDNNKDSEAAGPGPSASSKLKPAPSSTNPASSRFHFGGDESEEEEGGDEDGDEEAEGAEAGDGEDDLETAFEIFDMVRTILERQLGIGEDGGQSSGVELSEEERMRLIKLLSEVYQRLGDVCVESENFTGAVDEYTKALNTLSDNLPPSDRLLSEAHIMVSLALEYVPGRIGEAISHAESARDVLEAKLGELKVLGDTAEKRDLDEIEGIGPIMRDLEDKIEELKTQPVPEPPSEKEKLLQELISQHHPAAKNGAAAAAPVNDLTGTNLVRKKQPAGLATSVPVIEEEGFAKGKRKAEAEEVVVEGVNGTAQIEKKAKLDV